MAGDIVFTRISVIRLRRNLVCGFSRNFGSADQRRDG